MAEVAAGEEDLALQSLTFLWARDSSSFPVLFRRVQLP